MPDAPATAAHNPEQMARPLTVGALREGMKDLPDDAQVFVNVAGRSPDYAVEWAWASEQIPWSHDCTDADDAHRPGRDCPKTWGFEIHAQEISEFPDADDAAARP